MDLNNTLTLVSILGGILTIVGGLLGLFGAWRGWWESPERKDERIRSKAVADAILGEAAVPDLGGGLIQPGQPGLVARMAKVEEAVVEFRHFVGLLTETLKRLDVLEHRVGVIEGAQNEKTAIRLETAAMFDMVAKRDSDVIDPQEEP